MHCRPVNVFALICDHRLYVCECLCPCDHALCVNVCALICGHALCASECSCPCLWSCTLPVNDCTLSVVIHCAYVSIVCLCLYLVCLWLYVVCLWMFVLLVIWNLRPKGKQGALFHECRKTPKKWVGLFKLQQNVRIQISFRQHSEWYFKCDILLLRDSNCNSALPMLRARNNGLTCVLSLFVCIMFMCLATQRLTWVMLRNIPVPFESSSIFPPLLQDVPVPVCGRVQSAITPSFGDRGHLRCQDRGQQHGQVGHLSELRA